MPFLIEFDLTMRSKHHIQPSRRMCKFKLERKRNSVGMIPNSGSTEP